MRKSLLIILFIIVIIAALYGWGRYNKNETDSNTSAIDKILDSTATGSENTGANISISSGSADGFQYEGGGDYADYSRDAANSALQNGQRIVLVFDRKTDPTSDTLREDITANKSRIPKNTIIFFVNTDIESELVNNLNIEQANTIVYVGRDGNEIRRKGNGIVSLSQIVSGIDGLLTQ